MTDRLLSEKPRWFQPLASDHGLAANVALTAAFLFSYLLVETISFAQPIVKFGVTPLNPQTGLTLALLIARGPRWMPLAVVAALFSEMYVRGTPSPMIDLVASALWVSSCYACLAAFLRASGERDYLTSLRSSIKLAASVILTGLAAALGYAGFLVHGGSLPAESLWASAERYWVGDINGMLLLMPLLLAAPRWRNLLAVLRERRWEALAQLAAVSLSVPLVGGIAGIEQVRFLYPLFVPIIWIAVRWGATGALLGLLAIQIGLIAQVQQTQLPVRFIDLQFLVLTMNLTGLLLGTAVTERAKALSELAARASELRALLAVAPDAVLTADSAGQLRSANDFARRLFGMPIDAIDQGTAPPLHRLLPGMELLATEGRATFAGRRIDGSIFPAEVAWVRLVSPAPLGTLAIVRDATVRHLAETQARERETLVARTMRFAVAGELASSLAHELNQPITALVSYLRASQILAAPLAADEPRLSETLGKAAREANRAADMLIRLRDFYQGGGGTPSRRAERYSPGRAAHRAVGHLQRRHPVTRRR
jgi:PAS domain-containing protein